MLATLESVVLPLLRSRDPPDNFSKRFDIASIRTHPSRYVTILHIKMSSKCNLLVTRNGTYRDLKSPLLHCSHRRWRRWILNLIALSLVQNIYAPKNLQLLHAGPEIYHLCLTRTKTSRCPNWIDAQNQFTETHTCGLVGDAKQWHEQQQPI